MCFLGPCIVPCDSLFFFFFFFFFHPLSDHSLLFGASLSTLLLPSGCVCSLVMCFAFLRVFSPGLCSVLSRSSCSLALSFLAAVLFLLCFGTLLAIFFHVYSLGHRLLGFLLFVSIFSPFSCFWCVCPTSSGLPLGLVHAVWVPLLFFGISFPFSVVFPSILFWYARRLLLSSDLLGFAYFVGFAFSCCSGCGSTFSLPFGLRFSACCGSGCSLRSSSAFFHMLWLLLIVSVLPPHFSSCCSFGCPFLFLPPFPSVVTLPVLYGLRPGFSTSSASGCSSLLARLLLSSVLRLLRWQSLGCPGVAFPAFLLVFFRKVFSTCFVFLVPRAVFSPLVSFPSRVCCGVFRSGFGSFSAGSALLCCCGFMVICFLTRSNLRFPSQRGLPLGRVRFALASGFLSFELPACAGILSVFVSAPFLCLVRFWNYLSLVFTRWVASGFLGAQSSSVLVLSWDVSCSYSFV